MRSGLARKLALGTLRFGDDCFGTVLVTDTALIADTAPLALLPRPKVPELRRRAGVSLYGTNCIPLFSLFATRMALNYQKEKTLVFSQSVWPLYAVLYAYTAPLAYTAPITDTAPIAFHRLLPIPYRLSSIGPKVRSFVYSTTISIAFLMRATAPP